MKTPKHQQISSDYKSILTFDPLQYLAFERGDTGPLRTKPARQMQASSTNQRQEFSCTPREQDFAPPDSNDTSNRKGRQKGTHVVRSDAKGRRATKQRIGGLTELIVQLPEGGTREILGEAFTAIINGEGDIKCLRALTMNAARQLRRMYLSGGQKVIEADLRWQVRDYVWQNFGLQLSIGPRGLHLGEGQGPDELDAFLRIESNGHVWAGETYINAPEQPLTFPLTTEEVLQRLSEKLLSVVF